MNDTRDFERAVDRWLDDGTDATPPAVIDAVLLAARNAPQERDFRISWRTSPMKLLAYAVAAVAVLAVGMTALSALSPRFGIGSTSTPTATIQETSPATSVPQSPPQLASTFTSTIHGISMDYPSGWQIRQATEPWTGGELNFDSPAGDVIFDPALGDRLYFVLASKPVDAYAWALPQLCGPDEGGLAGGTVHVDGFNALDSHRCGSAFVEIDTPTRAYVILLVVADEPGLRGAYDEFFDATLETVDLRPEDAVDAPSRSESP